MHEKDKLLFFLIKEKYNGERLDKVLLNKFYNLTYIKVQKLIRVGFFKVNKKRAKAYYKVKSNDLIQYSHLPITKILKNEIIIKDLASIQEKYSSQIDDIKKNIIFEDDYLLVINKPSGLAVQGGSNVKLNLDLILPFLKKSNNLLRLVHRIDKNTSGLLMIAKSKEVAREVTMQFKKNTIKKKYWTIVIGQPVKQHGEIILPIKKVKSLGVEKMVVDTNSKQYAETFYKTLKSNNKLSLLEVLPKTGRKHQIRLHLKSINIPILGDDKYYIRESKIFNVVKTKMHLHAKEIKLELNNKRYFFNADLPEYFKKTIQINGLS